MDPKFPMPPAVWLNACAGPRIHDEVTSGVRVRDTSCFGEARGIAELRYGEVRYLDGARLALAPDDLTLSSDSHHYLYYASQDDHRWNRAVIDNGHVVLERDVRSVRLNLQEWKALSTSLLCLTIVNKHRDNDVITDDEVVKVALVLGDQ